MGRIFSQKKLIAAIVLLLTLIVAKYESKQIPKPQLTAGESTVWVRKVVDGDTIELGSGQRVRYIGINTAEIAHHQRPAEYYGKEAKEFNKKLVLGKSITLEFDEERYDKYNRTLAYVYLQDGTFINAELVKHGYARTMTIKPNTKYAELFKQLQEEAKRGRRGLWAKNSLHL